MRQDEGAIDTPPPTWFDVTLIVRSTDTAPSAITALLGTAPTSTRQRGEPLSQRNPLSAPRTENTWLLEALSLDAESLDDVIGPLLSRVSAVPTLPADCSVELSIGLTARDMGNMVGLGDLVVKRLAELGAPVVLDVYNSHDRP